MSEEINRFLKEHEPASMKDAREKIALEKKSAESSRNIIGAKLLSDPNFKKWIGGVIVNAGYLGGWRGRTDDFNQGVLFQAHQIIDSLGEGNKEAVLRVITNEGVERLKNKKETKT